LERLPIASKSFSGVKSQIMGFKHSILLVLTSWSISHEHILGLLHRRHLIWRARSADLPTKASQRRRVAVFCGTGDIQRLVTGILQDSNGFGRLMVMTFAIEGVQKTVSLWLCSRR
jgi:hypothetical protein